ncbi:MAG: glycosyl transferase family 1 [Chitinophagales bacterium]|nr:MAG: glycosyl transferase family 1 [Chitinophagales bacterium]
MRIALIEPFFSGSHRAWAEGYAQHSKYEVRIFSLSGHHWKWRMHGGAVTLARMYMESHFQADVILASDMLNLPVFLSITRKKTASTPVVLYFHENQLTYPWSPADPDAVAGRDNHYSFINYASALVADHVFFNSQYHREALLNALPQFLRAFPDYQETTTVRAIERKSSVLPLGLDLKQLGLQQHEAPSKPLRAVILWNHRWEYDKNPEDFFNALFALQERGIVFHLVVLGQKFDRYPPIFDEARQRLKEKILHFGFVEEKKEYGKWLQMSDILPVTSRQDFFGASVVEAMYCNVVPLLPKRLAYPEHIPPQLHYTFFYTEDNSRAFINRLQRMIMDVKVLRKQNVAQFVEHYDWCSMAPRYDEALFSLTKGK